MRVSIHSSYGDVRRSNNVEYVAKLEFFRKGTHLVMLPERLILIVKIDG